MTRAQRSLWVLTALTILAAGLVAQALTAPASLGTHILLTASVLLLAVSATLLARVLRYLTRVTRAQRRPPSQTTRGKPS